MELKQQLIHRKYHKSEAAAQITIGDDYSIPEGKPDVASILQKKAQISIAEVHTEKGKVRIRGELKLWIFYVTDRSSETVSSLSMEFPFDEILYMEGAVSGDHLKIDWKIDELRAVIVHPGKLSVRALVTLQGIIIAEESHQITEMLEAEKDICTKCATLLIAEPVMERKESYRVRDEVLLPANKPNVQEIIWKNLQLRGLDIRQQEGRLAVKGELLLFVIYQGEEENSAIQWLEQTIPFHGTLETPGLTPEMFGIPETEIAHQEIELKPDYDGEMRMFQIDLLLDIPMRFYEEHSCSVLEDAYSTKEQLQLQNQEVFYEKLRMCTQTKCRVSGQEKIEESGKILQILGHQAQLLQKRSRAVEQGILWEGNLEVQVLYITDNDSQPFGSVSVSVPCSQVVEIPGMQKEDLWNVWENLEQVFITMPEGNLIEVRGVIDLRTCVMELCSFQNITGVTAENYDQEAYQKLPGMVIHFVQPKETLWEIAKSNRTTIEEIKKLNELQADEIVSGQKLLLVKQTDGAVLM